MKMKKTIRFIAMLLCIGLLIPVFCACTPSAKVQKRVFDYLNKKYKGLEFELVSFSQDEKTSGRYKIHVLCTTNNVEFDIYYSSLLTTDSYSICAANALMEKFINEAIDPNSAQFTNIADIQWFDLFEEGSAGYKFREVGPDVSYELNQVKSIYRIRLASEDFEKEGAINEVVQSIFMAIDVLDAQGIELDKVTFEFTAEGKPFLFEASTELVKKADLRALEEKFATAEAILVPGETLYADKKVNVISMFPKTPSNGTK